MGNRLIQNIERTSFILSLDHPKILLNLTKYLCLDIFKKIPIIYRIRYENWPPKRNQLNFIELNFTSESVTTNNS